MSENKQTPEVVEESPKGGCGCNCSCGGESEDAPYVWENQASPKPPKKTGRSLLLILLLGMLFAGGLSMATAMAGDGSATAGTSCEGSACPVMRLKEAVFPSKASCGDQEGKSCGEKVGACPVSGASSEAAPASGEAKLHETAAPRVDASVQAQTVSAALASSTTECPADKSTCCKGKSCGGKDKK
ncbi:MAG: hypothetical protein GXY15_10075 [Candidatus Hydrogenedentes bacterium]|nr:hypothetical protein [Candidatus Hydrogenedentota bacterium]